jgi:sigma-B regulation protein RsbU (phosphoserine phosphatase)
VSPEAPENVAGRTKTSRPERILVVDDIDDNRQLLVRRLEREGFHDIGLAADGEEALSLLRAHSFDLMLLDIMMPKLDGYQVLERLKTEGRLHELPVIVISAHNEIDSAVRCIQLGAIDYLPKPFNATLLRARVSTSLEQKRLRDQVRAHLTRLESELDAARTLQKSMVPRDFPTPTVEFPVEVFAMMEPAREVGGDLYDFFPTPDGRFAFLIGDVSGKGVAAAMYMARTKNLFRLATNMASGDASPAEIVTLVNHELCEGNDTMMFVTLYFGILDPGTGDLEFCNAGHDAPYRLGDGKAALAEGVQGMALGLDSSWRYETSELRLTPGETLYLYTDGITEAADTAHALFTKQRLQDVLKRETGAPLDKLIGAVAEAVKDFIRSAEQSDDITAMAIRLLPK